MKKYTSDYAVYRGDMFITLGTIKEIAKFLDVSENTVRFYTSQAWKKRKHQIEIFRIEE